MILRGVPSTDSESWCFLVALEDFKRLTGREPEDFDMHKSPVAEFAYMVYPYEIIKAEAGKPTTLNIEWDTQVPVVEKREGEKT